VSRLRRLPGDGAHVLRTLADALALRERIGQGTRLAAGRRRPGWVRTNKELQLRRC